ncbi:MAG TPA: alcohol dehydrogenase catalytic domain-containing protein [Pseudolysinimonas sp.]|nr:alcohol dehydrogenase catalytic domain-containing protein [Pseudolysinimonas sp.]
MISAPNTAAVETVPAPVAAPGEVVVDVRRAGVCGTDAELFTGEMPYVLDGLTTFPIRIGHEWMGTVSAVGDGVDRAWIGRRVTGDTMLGCGVCERCRAGNQHVCEFHGEIGVRDGRPGALAEQLAVPASALHALPDSVSDVAGALVEPGGNALRSFQAARVGPGQRILILGAGTIGVLVALFARAAGVEVHLAGRSERSLSFARGLGFENAWSEAGLPDLPWHAVVDASNAPQLPARALDLVEPAGRVVYVGLAASPSTIDTRALVFKDVTAVGVLSASPALAATVAAYADGSVDPEPLVGAVVGLDDLPGVLGGNRPEGGPGPKIHVEI